MPKISATINKIPATGNQPDISEIAATIRRIDFTILILKCLLDFDSFGSILPAP